MKTGRARADALLRAALGSMPYGFSVWAEDRRLLLWNRRYLEMYRFPEERVSAGMSLLEICHLTVELGNHPGLTPEALHEIYSERLSQSANQDEVLKTEKPIRGRVISNSHIRLPGLGWIVMHEDITDSVEKQWLADVREKALAEQNMRFEAALSNMAQGLAMYDADMRLVICNERYRQMYNMPEELVRPGTRLEAMLAHGRGLGTVEIESSELMLEGSADSRGRSRAYRLSNGRVISVTRSEMSNGGLLTTHQDITTDLARIEAIKANQAELASQNMRFEAAVNNMSQGLCMFDRDERLVICNEPYAALYRLPPELVRPGTSLADIMAYRLSHGSTPREGGEAYLARGRKVIAQKGFDKAEIEMEDGRIIAIQHRSMPDGGWVATHEDVTEQRRIEVRVRHLARHDALTDLPNRVLLREEMEKLEARIQRNETVAVFCLDLDYFKTVNDTLGHGIGDKVLVAVARRLREASRESDIVARLGGDEFAILAHAIDGPRSASVVADRIVRSIARPIEVEGHQILIGTSIGIAMAPSDGQDAETLLRNADMALYRAKEEGRGAYHFFEKGMDAAMQRRRMLEQGLRVALSRGEFRLVYQPLMNLADNSICCFEALLRWDHPERGTIPPADFIPVAEETGVITAVGEWALHEACHTAANWPAHIRVAVNLSPVQFRSRGLVDCVTAALAASQMPASRLELEITESLLLVETEQTLQTLHRLRALGVRISMDDFGTGYSSLSYLRSFPFDKIKIDRSFVSGLEAKQDSTAIIRAVIGLGQSLGMATTAEGIETEEQLEVVRQQGCSEAQGFLLSAPITASGVSELLNSFAAAAPAPVGARTKVPRNA